MAITGSIHTNLGPLLCFLNDNSSSVDVYLFIVSPALANRHFGINFWGCQQYLRYIKVAIFMESYFQMIY